MYRTHFHPLYVQTFQPDPSKPAPKPQKAKKAGKVAPPPPPPPRNKVPTRTQSEPRTKPTAAEKTRLETAKKSSWAKKTETAAKAKPAKAQKDKVAKKKAGAGPKGTKKEPVVVSFRVALTSMSIADFDSSKADKFKVSWDRVF